MGMGAGGRILRSCWPQKRLLTCFWHEILSSLICILSVCIMRRFWDPIKCPYFEQATRRPNHRQCRLRAPSGWLAVQAPRAVALMLQLFLDVKRSNLNLGLHASDRATIPLRGQLLPSKESASEAFCHSEASGLRCGMP